MEEEDSLREFKELENSVGIGTPGGTRGVVSDMPPAKEPEDDGGDDSSANHDSDTNRNDETFETTLTETTRSVETPLIKKGKTVVAADGLLPTSSDTLTHLAALIFFFLFFFFTHYVDRHQQELQGCHPRPTSSSARARRR